MKKGKLVLYLLITTDTMFRTKKKFGMVKKLELSHYTPWRRLAGEEVYLLLILDLGSSEG
jgi:hypothetical protein